MQGFKDSQYLPTQFQYHKNKVKTIIIQRLFPVLSSVSICSLKCLHRADFFPFLSPIPKAGKRGSMPGTDTHLTSRGNLNISCSLFLSCLLAVSLSCPHLCISVCQYIFYCLPSNSLCPLVPSYLVNLCLGIRVNLVFSVNCQSLSKTKLVIPYKWEKYHWIPGKLCLTNLHNHCLIQAIFTERKTFRTVTTSRTYEKQHISSGM